MADRVGHRLHTTAQATADAATQRTVVELAGVIRDHGTRIGVVKVKFGLSMVDSVLTQGSAGGSTLRVDLIDSLGKVIASSAPATRFKPFAGILARSSDHEQNTAFDFNGDSTRAARRARRSPTADAGT